MSRISFEEAYRRWRNKARKFSRTSLLDAAFRAFGYATPGVEGIQHAPWQLALLVKWVCQDRMMQSGVAVSDEEVLQLRQDLWVLGQDVDGLSGGARGLLLFRQIIAQQLVFQRIESYGMFRDAFLVAGTEPNSTLRRRFVALIGMSPESYMEIGFLIFALTRGFPQPILNIQHLERSLPSINGDDLIAFLSLFSASYQKLASFLQGLPDRAEKSPVEYFETPALCRFPLRKNGDSFASWHPSIFQRAIKSRVHMMIKGDGAAFQKFTHIFESHARHQARRAHGSLFLDEDQLREHLPCGSRCPDGILIYQESNVFLEFKAAAFEESAEYTGSEDWLQRKTNHIQEAIKQGVAASNGIRQHGTLGADRISHRKDYLLVVTNNHALVSTGIQLGQMLPSGSLSWFEAASALTLERVIVLDVDSFERLIRYSQENSSPVDAMLDSFVSRNRDMSTALFLFEQHLDLLRVPNYVCCEIGSWFNNRISI